jgi:hypothetical protein
MILFRRLVRVAAGACLIAAACSPSSGPQVGSQTNWFRACDSTNECGQLECICGVCTSPCSSDADCSGSPGATCAPLDAPGTVDQCGAVAPRPICLPTIQVRIDPTTRFQTLIGFGGGIAFTEDAMAGHPARAALFEALFVDAGLDALRLRNRYENGNDADLSVPSAIVQAARERLGQSPVLLMSAGSPPASLKENGERACGGNVDTCTLARLASGGFDYAAFADYWRTSVEAYARAGIALDYLGIQNHPNLVPSADLPGEACRFLPEQGAETVNVGGVDLEVTFPGYRDAFAAVRERLADLPSAPKLVAPEVTGPRSVTDYIPPLGGTSFDALSFHLYGVDPSNIDVAALEEVHALAGDGRPALQSEIRANARDTAVLMHHSLTAAGAAAYLQNDLVSLREDDTALVELMQDSFETQLVYDVFTHYARHTDPGWVRVDAASDADELLVSAWLAPDEHALTLVLTNPGATEMSVAVPVPAAFAGRSELTRTVFDGFERSTLLGMLPADGVVRLPAGSVVTVALTRE